MSDTVLVAVVSSGAPIVITVVALILNHRSFGSLERRIEVIEKDLKEFVG
jgi:hypothetical protein